MDFFNKVAGAWERGSEVVLKDDNGNDISLQRGINFVMNKAKKYEESSKDKTKANLKNNNEQVII